MSHESQSVDTPTREPPQKSRRLGWLLLLVIAVVLSAALVMVFRFTAARRIPELTPAALDAAIELWEAAGPESYDLELEIDGNRPGTVLVEVRRGIVLRMQRDGNVPTQRRTWDVWSVPGQFDMIERELEMAADPESQMHAQRGTRVWLRCEFHPLLGYPVKFHRAVTPGGPEVYWQVTRFEQE